MGTVQQGTFHAAFLWYDSAVILPSSSLLLALGVDFAMGVITTYRIKTCAVDIHFYP